MAIVNGTDSFLPEQNKLLPLLSRDKSLLGAIFLIGISVISVEAVSKEKEFPFKQWK